MSETNELEALLRRWAELEPEWARIAAYSIPKDDEYQHGSWAHSGKFVQIAVQEAIEARGWIWHMQNAFNQDGADCYVAYLSGINDEEEFACDTPAAALLSAYLAALKFVTP